MLTTFSRCTVGLCINRNRLKEYSKKYYMKDGQNFEIEIFNPHQFNVLAKIYFNEICISTSGLVIKPGQRVFLERFIDDATKFEFKTYEVENSKEAKAAIAKNGLVKVVFYYEQSKQSKPNINWHPVTPNWDPWKPDFVTYTTNTSITGGLGINGANFNLSNDGMSLNTSNTSSYSGNVSSFLSQTSFNAGILETGRIESGAKSDQEFSYVNVDFNSWTSESHEFQILPASAKPTEVAEIRNYCTECGTRVKKSSWKFCPSCGNKVN